MTSPRVLLASVVVLALAGEARADHWMSSGKSVTELSHQVEVSTRDGQVRYKVARAFRNNRRSRSTLTLEVALPAASAVESFRFDVGAGWQVAKLETAAAADALYDKVPGKLAAVPRGTGRMRLSHGGAVELLLYPIAPGGVARVEYGMVGTTEYNSGAFSVRYPLSKSDEFVSPVVTLRPEAGASRVVIGDQVAVAGVPMVLAPTNAAADGRSGRVASGASTATSVVEVTDGSRVNRVDIALDIEHPYRGDLEVVVVSPRGRSTVLHNRQGGGEDNIVGTFSFPAEAGADAKGKWMLRVTDRATGSAGTIRAWSVRTKTQQGTQRVFASRQKTPIPDAIFDSPSVDGQAQTDGEDSGNSGSPEPVLLSLAAPRIDIARARLGQFRVSPKRAFSRFEIDVAPQLSPMPKKLRVVFVVDASYSATSSVRNVESFISQYLAHIPDGSFEVISFHRKASRVFGGFASATSFDEANRQKLTQSIKPRNGSALDEAIRLAARALRGTSGPSSIVIVTDGELRSRLVPATLVQLARSTPRTTVTQLALLGGSGGGDHFADTRVDSHALVPVARAGRGIVVRLNVDSDKGRLSRSALGLIRPVRIDDIKLSSASGADLGLADVLVEGTGYAKVFDKAAAETALTVTGKLWNRTFKRTYRAQSRWSRTTAVALLTSDAGLALDEQTKDSASVVARVVTETRSLVSAEPGERPLSGLGSIGGRVVGWSSSCGCCGVLRARPVQASMQTIMADVVAARCGTVRGKGTLTASGSIESQSNEILDVRLTGDRQLVQCATEAIWDTYLDRRFDTAHKDWPVSFAVTPK